MRIGTISIIRKAVIVLVATLSVLQPLHAQKSGKGHELRFGIAGWPVGAALSSGIGYRDYYCVEPPGFSSRDRYHDYAGDLKSYGTLSLQYSYNFNDKRAIGMDMGFDPMFRTLYDGISGQKKGHANAWGVSFTPVFRRTWNPDNRLKFYLAVSLGLGIGIYHGSDYSAYYPEWSLVPIFQFTPVGMTYGGDRFFGFAELSQGTLNFGGRIGVGYKF